MLAVLAMTGFITACDGTGVSNTPSLSRGAQSQTLSNTTTLTGLAVVTTTSTPSPTPINSCISLATIKSSNTGSTLLGTSAYTTEAACAQTTINDFIANTWWSSPAIACEFHRGLTVAVMAVMYENASAYSAGTYEDGFTAICNANGTVSTVGWNAASPNNIPVGAVIPSS
jgi:hypothetical protein